MHRLFRLFSTSIGRKLVMAATGLLLMGFLLSHLYGNLKVFQGPAAINSYAAWLAGHPFLWVARIGLLSIFVIHIGVGFSLWRESRAARPIPYARNKHQRSTFASRQMLMTGMLILAFVVYHLLHFTFGKIQPESYGQMVNDQVDVYRMVVLGFKDPWISGTYIAAMLLLGLHLMHGAGSLFQTFGVNHESYDKLIGIACVGVVARIVIGNCSIPVVMLLDLEPVEISK